MKKILVVISMVLLMTAPLFAQTPNEATRAEGKSSFTHIAVVGMARDDHTSSFVSGIPGYIEMMDDNGSRFYIFVDNNGYLRIASATEVSTTDAAGAPTLTGDWRSAGDKVGSQ